MSSRRHPPSATRPLAHVACAALLAAGCNALTLDGLQAGSGGSGSATGTGGEAPTTTSSTTTATTSTVSAGGSTSGSTSTGAGGEGGAPGTGGGGGGGGDTGPGGAGGAGGACPDVCAQVDATFCDAFDASDDLDAWYEAVFDTPPPSFTIVDDPHVSCPHAARVAFEGAESGTDGGWAQLGRTIPGSPTTARVDLRILRQPSASALEGMFEIAWDRGEAGCFFQVYAAEQPRTVAFYADQYGVVDAPLGEDSANLIESTVDRWMDVSVTIEVGATPRGSVTIDGVTIESELDAAGAASCDEGIDPSSLEVRLGAPYNQLPTVLLYDDVVVTTE